MTFFLFGGALLSSYISGLTGFAGGFVLLTTLSFYFDMKVAVALHALLQTFSNFTRFLIFWREVHFSLVFFYILGILPGIYLGVKVFQDISESYLKIFAGVFILISLLFKIKPLHSKIKNGLMVGAGILGGFLGMLVGVVGPAIAPFIRGVGLSKNAFIGTKATCQLSLQGIKIAVFVQVLSFNYDDHVNNLLAMALAIFLGTLVARFTLKKVPPQIFNQGVQYLLFVMATALIVQGVYEF